IVALGVLPPWERLVMASCGDVPGCFGPRGPGPTTVWFSGSQLPNGQVAMPAGVAISIAGLVMIAHPASRRFCAVALAAGVVVAGDEGAAWWLKYRSLAVIPAGAIEAGGLLLGLAAVPLCLPGHVRQRVLLLVATLLLIVAGAFVVWSGTTSETIV